MKGCGQTCDCLVDIRVVKDNEGCIAASFDGNPRV